MHSNIDIVKNYYEAFNRKDYRAMEDLLAENVIHYPNEGEPRHGKNDFASFMEKMDEAYDETLKDLILFQGEASHRVAAEFTVHGTYKKAEAGLPEAHGQAYILPAGAFLEVEAEKITRITTYYNLSQWISLVSAR